MNGGRSNTFVECSDTPSHLPEAHGFVYRTRFVSVYHRFVLALGERIEFVWKLTTGYGYCKCFGSTVLELVRFGHC